MLESLYCALIVYVPACSGLSGRLIDAVPRLLRNWNVPATEPLGRVTLNTTPPVGDAPVLLVTVAVIVGAPLVRVGFCELVSVVVVGISCAGAAAGTSRALSAAPTKASAQKGTIARSSTARQRPTHPPGPARAAYRADARVF